MDRLGLHPDLGARLQPFAENHQDASCHRGIRRSRRSDGRQKIGFEPVLSL